MTMREMEGGVVLYPEDKEKARQYHKDLRTRLDKLSRTYDLTTMKIFMTVEALGEEHVYSTYDPERKLNWETFLVRREACRLDLTRHDKTRDRYEHFLSTVAREEQGKQFFHAMIDLLLSKGALDVFRSPGRRDIGEGSFCGQLCRLFDKKMCAWFDTFEAVNVRLTAHVKVSNLVRVLTGQVDALCRRDGLLYAINVKITGMPTPRPLDIMELCMIKVMVIQNGLAAPNEVVPCLLACHLSPERPVLRLWEYRPSQYMDDAIREADIDRMIHAGRASQHAELWPGSVCPPGPVPLTVRHWDTVGGQDMGRHVNGDPENQLVRTGSLTARQIRHDVGAPRSFNTHDQNISLANTNSNKISYSNTHPDARPLRYDNQEHEGVNSHRTASSRPGIQTAIY